MRQRTGRKALLHRIDDLEPKNELYFLLAALEVYVFHSCGHVFVLNDEGVLVNRRCSSSLRRPPRPSPSAPLAPDPHLRPLNNGGAGLGVLLELICVIHWAGAPKTLSHLCAIPHPSNDRSDPAAVEGTPRLLSYAHQAVLRTAHSLQGSEVVRHHVKHVRPRQHLCRFVQNLCHQLLRLSVRSSSSLSL